MKKNLSESEILECLDTELGKCNHVIRELKKDLSVAKKVRCEVLRARRKYKKTESQRIIEKGW